VDRNGANTVSRTNGGHGPDGANGANGANGHAIGDGRVAMKVIGGAIREARAERRLTLEVLAKQAEISYQYLSGIECGKENFSIYILEKIARALEIPMPQLIASAYKAPTESRPANGHG
jgi:DNA-binding XRE family transcriptional regulator